MAMRSIYLEGELGQRFGERFPVNADTFADALRCLDCNLEGFRQYFIEAHEKNINFVANIAEAPVQDERELLMVYKEGDFVLSPLPTGAKSGAGKLLAAAALLVITGGIGFYASGAAAAAGSTSFGSAIATGLSAASGNFFGQLAIGLAVNLALQGIQQIMAPDPSVDNDQEESYLFQGSGQTAIEGDPVPILYGKLRVPGRPISFESSSPRTITNINGFNPALPQPGNGQGSGDNEDPGFQQDQIIPNG